MTSLTQGELVYAARRTGQRMTLWEIAGWISEKYGRRCAETAISARIRELPKKYGAAYDKEERVVDGKKLRNTFEYWLDSGLAGTAAQVSSFGSPFEAPVRAADGDGKGVRGGP